MNRYNIYIFFYSNCCSHLKKILLCRGTAQTGDMVCASVVHKQSGDRYFIKATIRIRKWLSVAWTVKSIMLLINVALSSNVFLSSHPLSVSYQFVSAHSSLFSSRNLFLTLALCARPIHFLIFLSFRCDESGYNFVRLDKKDFWLNLDARIIFRHTSTV